ncbi:hypothetical protein BB8028_0007g02510 [Beauveria bassiana]|uniref:Uncharacterized protein n=1 Tax=Beauveria bassiana TaxID=176275 RepID=A0A2S7YMI2_BEABA|nr:hypothetical protein BB8028_0007g02510 [Beauveria bassiana]
MPTNPFWPRPNRTHNGAFVLASSAFFASLAGASFSLLCGFQIALRRRIFANTRSSDTKTATAKPAFSTLLIRTLRTASSALWTVTNQLAATTMRLWLNH